MANWAGNLMQATDSKSLWNYTTSPGWSDEEVAVLSLALQKEGVGRWKQITKYLPAKTVAQLNLQTQRLMGQQSLAAFTNIRLNPRDLFDENAKLVGMDVRRKNGCIVNTGNKMTKEERRALIAENTAKYGISEEEASKIVVPVVADPNGIDLNTREGKLIHLDLLYERQRLLQERLVVLQQEEGVVRRRPKNKKR